MKTVLEYLETYCEEITPFEFYRRIFPPDSLERKGVYETGKYNAIAVSISKNKRIKRFTVTDDLDMVNSLCATDDFCIMSPISYAGKSRKSENARFLHALAIDLDGIRMRDYKGEPSGMVDLFYQFDGNGPSNYLPKPSMIVMSGSGIHIYYVFKKPIPMFPNIVKQLNVYKRRLTWQLWTQGVSDLQDTVQYESLFQGFRMPGTMTKDGNRARAFLVDSGDPVTMEYMNEFVPADFKTKDFTYKSDLTLPEAKSKYPEWYEKRIVQKKPKGSWQTSRAVYDWWKRKIYEGAEDGHRYWAVMALAAYAKKCGIERAELEKDALGMIEMLDERGKREDNPFTVDDVMAALEAYNDSYITYPIDTISYRTGIHIEKNKRNGRQQAEHLKRCRIIQMANDMVDGTNWREKNGRKSKKEIVYDYVKAHSEVKNKSVIARDLKISRPTVIKYYDEVVAELEQERLKNERLKKMEQNGGHISVKVSPSEDISNYFVEQMTSQKRCTNE